MIELLMVAAIGFPQDSRTTCNTYFGQTTCDTRVQPTVPFDPYGAARANATNNGIANGYALGSAMRERREAQERADEARRNETTARNLRHRVSASLQMNDCDTALSIALAGGDIALARDVRAFCATPAPTAPVAPQ